MSPDIVFHKSCYTSRSSGYKYRTLATNTGEKKRRDSKEDATFDTKFKEMRGAIVCRVDKHFDDAHKMRNTIFEKFATIDSKIDSMLELQNTVKDLRKNLTAAENTLADLQERVEKLDLVLPASSTSTFLTNNYGRRSCNVISSTFGSNVTQIHDRYRNYRHQSQSNFNDQHRQPPYTFPVPTAGTRPY